MATLAKLNVQISGNTTKLTSALKKAEGRLAKFRKAGSKALKAVGTAAKGLAIGGGIAIAGFAVAAVKNFLDVGEQLDKMVQADGRICGSWGVTSSGQSSPAPVLIPLEKGLKVCSSAI